MARRSSSSSPRIRNLREHTDPYVTTSELAQYWAVSRKQIYKQIEAGTLKAIRLGPRLLRISTAEALAFERSARMMADIEDEDVAVDRAAVRQPRRR